MKNLFPPLLFLIVLQVTVLVSNPVFGQSEQSPDTSEKHWTESGKEINLKKPRIAKIVSQGGFELEMADNESMNWDKKQKRHRNRNVSIDQFRFSYVQRYYFSEHFLFQTGMGLEYQTHGHRRSVYQPSGQFGLEEIAILHDSMSAVALAIPLQLGGRIKLTTGFYLTMKAGTEYLLLTQGTIKRRYIKDESNLEEQYGFSSQKLDVQPFLSCPTLSLGLELQTLKNGNFYFNMSMAGEITIRSDDDEVPWYTAPQSGPEFSQGNQNGPEKQSYNGRYTHSFNKWPIFKLGYLYPF